jgi:2-C-methyl-D-erythritol 4-phosphate cytidylyltransferase/2-C-methyl-D-erythritol 2,4-cyclodiphosphate synthase
MLVVPESAVELVRRETLGWKIPFSVVPGGAERQESVVRGIRAASREYVLVHDGARPFLSGALVERLLESLTDVYGVAPLLPVSDALKKTGEDGTFSPFPREGLWLTQTPQAFHREKLLSVLQTHGGGAKDEAEAWIAAGHPLRSVRGERKNIKITWEEDFSLAELYVQRTFRTGTGYDVHPLVPGRRFILGGVDFPEFPLGFAGYSDGDVLVHAVCDALLGAAGLGDIGTLYPAGNPAFKNISSLLLLADAAKRVTDAGWTLEWSDSVICAQEPKLAASLSRMVSMIEEVLPETWWGRVHLKVKSGEHVGPVGHSHCIVCYSNATLWKPLDII